MDKNSVQVPCYDPQMQNVFHNAYVYHCVYTSCHTLHYDIVICSTSDSHGLGDSIYMYYIMYTVAMTPLTVFACPTSHQFVSGCDMWQSWVEGVSNYVYYIQYMVAVTPLSLFACPTSHQFVAGCDMWQSLVEGDSISIYYIQYTVAMTPLSVFGCPMSHHFVIGCDMWQAWVEGVSIYMYYIYYSGYDSSVWLSMSYVSSHCRWMWHVTVMVWGRVYLYVLHILQWLWQFCLT